MGSWTESISDRELPEELVNFRLKSANELARELTETFSTTTCTTTSCVASPRENS